MQLCNPWTSGDDAEVRCVYDSLSRIVEEKQIHGILPGAEKLVDLDHAPHIAMSWGTDAIIPFLKIYEQFAEAGIKTYAPFTSDPKPFDYKNLNPGPVNIRDVH